MWMLKRKEQAVAQSRTEPAPLLQPGPPLAAPPTVVAAAPAANSVTQAAMQTAAPAGAVSVPPAAATVRPVPVAPSSAPSQAAPAPVRLGVSPVSAAAPSVRPSGIAAVPPGGNPGPGQVSNGAQMAQAQTRQGPPIAAGNSNPPEPPASVVPVAPRAPVSGTPMSLTTEPLSADTQPDGLRLESKTDEKATNKLGDTGGDGSGGGTTPPSGPLIGISDATVETFASAALGQVVSMLGEDTRTYLQGMEQIYTAAAGKALAMIASGVSSEQETGKTLLTQIKASQQDTTAFATDIASLAKQFVSIKGG